MDGHAITHGACLLVLLVAVMGCGEDGPSATVRFVAPADGARVVGAGDLATVEDAFRLVDVDDMGPGADWTLSACGIDIDGSG